MNSLKLHPTRINIATMGRVLKKNFIESTTPILATKITKIIRVTPVGVAKKVNSKNAPIINYSFKIDHF